MGNRLDPRAEFAAVNRPGVSRISPQMPANTESLGEFSAVFRL